MKILKMLPVNGHTYEGGDVSGDVMWSISSSNMELRRRRFYISKDVRSNMRWEWEIETEKERERERGREREEVREKEKQMWKNTKRDASFEEDRDIS